MINYRPYETYDHPEFIEPPDFLREYETQVCIVNCRICNYTPTPPVTVYLFLILFVPKGKNN